MTPVENDATPSSERDGVLRLESFNLEAKCCTWGLANVRVNREKAGKGRPLSKKQREWRLDTPFDSLLLVRIACAILNMYNSVKLKLFLFCCIFLYFILYLGCYMDF